MEEEAIRILSREEFANRFYGENLFDARIDSEYENYLDEKYRLKFLVRNANNGDVEACYKLGLMLQNGEIFTENSREASYYANYAPNYFKYAAHYGHALAAYEMFKILKRSTPQDEELIRYFYTIYVKNRSKQQRAKDLYRER